MPYRNPDKEPLTPEEARAALERAHAAAQAGDAVTMLEELAESGFLDGLVRRVAGRWRRLGHQAAEDVVADAVGALYRRVRRAASEDLLVDRPDAYLSKSVFGIAHDEWKRRDAARKAEKEHGELRAAHDGDDASRDVLRAEAVQVARHLLSRLGQENVQRVMAIVLDAVADLEPVSNVEIANALDLTPNHVAKLIERGITRLGRIAEEEGFDLTLDYAIALEDDPNQED